jgi:hypothetical protein
VLARACLVVSLHSVYSFLTPHDAKGGCVLGDLGMKPSPAGLERKLMGNSY